MLVYLDTNVFIAAIEHDDALARKIEKLLRLGRQEAIGLITSELTLAELLVKPFSLQETGQVGTTLVRSAAEISYSDPVSNTPSTLLTTYSDLISDGPALTVAAVDRQILVEAAYLRAQSKRLKLPDAIHLATSIKHQCTHFVSSDSRVRADIGADCVALALGENEIDELLLGRT